MRRVLFCLLTALVWAQDSNVPYAETMGPLFRVADVQWSFPARYDSIRVVDFRNLPLEPGGPRLTNGKFEQQDRGQFDSFDLDSIFYLDPRPSPGATYALVICHWVTGGGSTASSGIAQVYRLSNRGLAATQRITWDVDAPMSDPKAKYFEFDPKSKTLLLRSSHYIPGDAHCCISAIDAVTLVWAGGRFRKSSIRTELSEYGRKEGKRLSDR